MVVALDGLPLRDTERCLNDHSCRDRLRRRIKPLRAGGFVFISRFQPQRVFLRRVGRLSRGDSRNKEPLLPLKGAIAGRERRRFGCVRFRLVSSSREARACCSRTRVQRDRSSIKMAVKTTATLLRTFTPRQPLGCEVSALGA